MQVKAIKSIKSDGVVRSPGDVFEINDIDGKYLADLKKVELIDEIVKRHAEEIKQVKKSKK